MRTCSRVTSVLMSRRGTGVVDRGAMDVSYASLNGVEGKATLETFRLQRGQGGLHASQFALVPIHLRFVVRRLLAELAYPFDERFRCRDERHRSGLRV